MKKYNVYLNFLKTFCLILVLTLLLVGCKKDEPKPDTRTECEKNGHTWVEATTEEARHCSVCGITDGEPLLGKHLILDSNGNYGGTTNRSKYGTGAPLNGEYDNMNTPYYLFTDYYNMKSTSTRTIFSKFSPYQQTMADSSGIACALMVLNYLGEDVQKTYTEVNLVNRYEELMNTQVYKNGTTPEGLVKLMTDIGYKAEDANYVELASTTMQKIADFNSWVKETIDAGKFIFVRYQDTMDYGWHVIIGYDSMGTEYAKDDVIIFADPFDNTDHYQDGYNASATGRFYRWWMNVDKAGNTTDQFSGIVVTPKTPINFTRVEETNENTQEVPDRHLLLNPDGSFGGTRNASLYGSIPEKNGETDHLNSVYHKFVDYYNMVNSDTRYILSNYMAFQQTMASSCGICATMSVLNYYDYDINTYDEVWLTDKYCEVNDKETIKNVGVGSGGLKKLVAVLGIVSTSGSYSKANYVNESSMKFSTYDAFQKWVVENLQKGTPMPVSWRPQGGHWEVIIGYDSMGNDNPYDDVIILADSHDTFDHYQDGYNTLPAYQFYRQWYNGSFTYNQQFNIFDRTSK